MTTIDDCRLIELPTIHRAEGNITPIQNGELLPFDIARTYYLYDVPGGVSRGGHAHKELHQLLISVMGAFDVVLNDGMRSKTVRLERAYFGLYIPPMIWRELENFSSGGICVVLASLPYDENEYVRDQSVFVKAKSAPVLVN